MHPVSLQDQARIIEERARSGQKSFDVKISYAHSDQYEYRTCETVQEIEAINASLSNNMVWSGGMMRNSIAGPDKLYWKPAHELTWREA